MTDDAAGALGVGVGVESLLFFAETGSGGARAAG